VIGHRNPVAALLVWLVRGYQAFISPGLPGRCKYYPSCSQYAIDSLREFGVLRGLVLASWRVLRCNPFGYGGYDPVERQTLFAPRSGEDSSGPRKVSRSSRPRRQRAGTV